MTYKSKISKNPCMMYIFKRISDDKILKRIDYLLGKEMCYYRENGW